MQKNANNFAKAYVVPVLIGVKKNTKFKA